MKLISLTDIKFTQEWCMVEDIKFHFNFNGLCLKREKWRADNELHHLVFGDDWTLKIWDFLSTHIETRVNIEWISWRITEMQTKTETCSFGELANNFKEFHFTIFLWSPSCHIILEYVSSSFIPLSKVKQLRGRSRPIFINSSFITRLKSFCWIVCLFKVFSFPFYLRQRKDANHRSPKKWGVLFAVLQRLFSINISFSSSSSPF